MSADSSNPASPPYRVWEKVPGELRRPWPLAILLPATKALLAEAAEVAIGDGEGMPRVLDNALDAMEQLMAHVERLEGVRTTWEDLYLAEKAADAPPETP